jgi:hypothetical protein
LKSVFAGGVHSGRWPPEAIDIETITVTAQRLDDALPDGYLPTLLKIDVEGAEADLFAGAPETLAKLPVVAFEHDPAAVPTSGQVHDTLTGAGLRIFDMDGQGPYTRGRFEGAAGRFNWVAHR